MNEMFSQGGKGSTGILTNKQAIARKFGVKQSEVVYFSTGAALYGYKVIYDKETQRAYSLPTDIAAGTTATTLSTQAVLVHSAGSVDLGSLAVTRGEFVTLPGSFVTGGTVNTRNELLIHEGNGYHYLGALPVTVAPGSTPVGDSNWNQQTDSQLRQDLESSNQDWASKLHTKAAYTGQVRKTIQEQLDERPTVLDFGALGDGTGRTPADDGISILNEPWNTWDGTPFKDNLSYSPYEQSGSFVPPRAKPFADTDTWDFIGITRCLWKASVDVPWTTYLPAGRYVINLDNNRHPLFKGLLLMKGMEQTILGAGKYDTQIVCKEGSTFFANAGAGANKYQLIDLYRVGGPPTNLSRFAVLGPDNYPQPMGNLSLIWGQNINGVTFEELWVSSCARGVSLDTSSGDSHMKGSTFEFCFNESVYVDSTSELSVDFCNFWSSSTYNTQHGVYGTGRISVNNCRFVDYHGYSLYAGRGLFSNNYFQLEGTVGNAVVLGSGSIFNNNQMIGNTSDAMVMAFGNTVLSGNSFTQGTQHPCLQLGSNDGNFVGNVTVTGCMFLKTDTTSAGGNVAIIAPKDGSYSGAATNSCLITSCTFQGPALTQVGKASHRNCTINGEVGAETYYGDTIAPTVTTGTFTGASYTGSVSGFYGQNDTSLRGRQRLHLLTVNSEGNSHSVTAFCYFRTNHDGAVVIVQTIGTSGLGGDITFSASGGTPLFTINNTQATGGTFTANSRVVG